MHVLNSLLPVFLLLLLGKLLTRTAVFSGNLQRDLSRLTYWVALPSLIISKVSSASLNSSEVSRITLLMILAPLAAGALAYLIAYFLRIERKALGAFVQGAVRGNNAFVGLPIIIYALGEVHPEAETIAILALAPAIIIYNVISIAILISHSDGSDQLFSWATFKMVGKRLITNPLLIAGAIGLTLNTLDAGLPSPAQRMLSTLGQMAPGMALLSIGASLSFRGIRIGLGRSIPAALLQCFVQPLVGLGLALTFNLPPLHRQILLIFLACPTGVASYVLADLFGSDKELAAHIIVVSTLLSALSLSAVIAFGG